MQRLGIAHCPLSGWYNPLTSPKRTGSLNRSKNSSSNYGPERIRAVFLVGFMGAGKTVIGRELSRRLNWKFADLDDRIVASAGKLIPQIFASEGEAGFRRREHNALESLIASLSEPTIVALGGGAFVQPDNLELIQRCGIPSVFLDAEIDTLLKRCHSEKGSRPLAQDENQFRQLYEQRRSGYMKADHCVQTAEKAVRDIVDEVMSCLGWSNEVSDSPPRR